MLVRNKRTGVVGELRDSVALTMIELGKVEEVKTEKIEKTSNKKLVANESKSKKNKHNYKTRDMKAESE